MNKIRKCDYGYGKSHLIKSIIITIIMLSASLFVYFLGIHISGNNKNLLTLVAVLGMLPAAKEIVNVIMCIKAYKYKCSDELHKAITSCLLNAEKPLIRYDLYITSYANLFPVYALTCFNDTVIGISDFDKFNHAAFEEHIKALSAQNGLKISTVKIFNNENKFIERIETFKLSSDNISENDYKLIRLMENISL